MSIIVSIKRDKVFRPESYHKLKFIRLFPDTLSLGHKEHAVNTEKYVYYRKVQKIIRYMTGIGN